MYVCVCIYIVYTHTCMYLGLVFFIKYSVKGLYKVLYVGTVNPTVLSIMLIIYGAPTLAIKLIEMNVGFRVIHKTPYFRIVHQSGRFLMYIYYNM